MTLILVYTGMDCVQISMVLIFHFIQSSERSRETEWSVSKGKVTWKACATFPFSSTFHLEVWSLHPLIEAFQIDDQPTLVGDQKQCCS